MGIGDARKASPHPTQPPAAAAAADAAEGDDNVWAGFVVPPTVYTNPGRKMHFNLPDGLPVSNRSAQMQVKKCRCVRKEYMHGAYSMQMYHN